MRLRLLSGLYNRKKSVAALLIILNFFVVYRSDVFKSRKDQASADALLPIESNQEVTVKLEVAQTKAELSEREKADLLRRSKEERCYLPGIIHNGVPYPNCIEKIHWMKASWKSDPCYANHGVTDDICSIIRYLSHIESHCPRIEHEQITLEPLCLNGEKAVARTSFDHLLNELGNVTDFKWIKSRINMMKKSWIKSAGELFASDSASRAKKRIHLHLGFLKTGGKTLGELAQWSDLISALFAIGHNIVITRDKRELEFVYYDYINQWNIDCPTPGSNDARNIPFDLIYTDGSGYGELSSVFTGNKIDGVRCRLRILETSGVEAEWNKQKDKSGYVGLRLNLQQFQTMYPHTPDNTFLGFAADTPMTAAGNKMDKRNITLIYGNVTKKKKEILDIIKEYVSEVHATVTDAADLPSYVINHGEISPMEYVKLLDQTKIFIGLGTPHEGPAALEAIHHGAIFLNPRYSTPVSSENNDLLKSKPTGRQMSSQNPYAEKYIGKPNVHTINIEDVSELRSVLMNITQTKRTNSFIPYEFTVEGMLQRVSVLIDRQQFCTTIPFSRRDHVSKFWWPPLGFLKMVMTSQSSGWSCNDACEEKGLICEPAFFPAVNSENVFERFNVSLSCDSVMLPTLSGYHHPGYSPDTKTCHLQTNPLMFSCSAKSPNVQRICPCRSYEKQQIAFPKHARYL